MATYQYTIRLTNDAEPGTGLGGEVINELVPRDQFHRPVLAGSHIKGLMRDALRNMDLELWQMGVLPPLFGEPGDTRHDVDAPLRVGPAIAPVDTVIHTVTRTSVAESGVAQDRTLRTTEVVPLGTVFQGEVHCSAPTDSPLDLAWRLALLAIPAVGGSRNRGCGVCVIELAGERRSPGTLLKLLDKRLRENPDALTRPATLPPSSPRKFDSEPAVIVRLVFEADTPICCPEIADKTNVISTGFSIPASAVQGLLLTRLNTEDPALATALFDSPQFRAWPLQPCWCPQLDAQGRPANDQLPVPIHVSLTHRVAKFSIGDEKLSSEAFQDEAIAQYDWTKTVNGAPLKASDGVLLKQPDGRIELWKARSMPHVITSHGVHDDPNSESGRNLYTVDAMAPLIWQGLAVLPASAAEQLIASLQRDPRVAVGKSRTVRGLGRLHASRMDGVPSEWQLTTQARHEPNGATVERTLLVVQSPLRIDEAAATGRTAEEQLYHTTRAWTEKHGLPPPEMPTWANIGVRFGWSRLSRRRLEACRVVLPGSVFALRGHPDPRKLAVAIQAGIGDDADRRRGFGAVCVHPGKAIALFEPNRAIKRVAASDPDQKDAVKTVLGLARATERLPSASQIRAVEQRVARFGVAKTLEYLSRQRDERTSRIWSTWEPIFDKVIELLKRNERKPAVARHALEVLADLSLLATREESH